MATTPEGKVQTYCKARLKEAGFLVRKFTYEGRNGATDLIAVNVITAFIEVKKDEDTAPDPHQVREHERLRNHGALTFTVGSFKQVDAMIHILRFKAARAKADNLKAILR